MVRLQVTGGGAARNESGSSRLAGATHTMSAAAGAIVGAAFALSMLYALPAYAHANALQQTTTHENVLTTVSETQDSTKSTKDAADGNNAASTQDEAGKSQQNSQQHLLQTDTQQQPQQEQNKQPQLEEQTQAQPQAQQQTQAQPADLHWVRNGYGVWYRNQDGSYPYSTWTHDSEGWHYFDSWGYAVSGWYKVPSGKWFYFDPRQEHHRLVVGDCFVNGYHYWIDESAGLVYNNWVHEGAHTWRYTDEWGILRTGWYKTPSGKWFYFDPHNNGKATFGCVKADGHIYWIDENAGFLYSQKVVTPTQTVYVDDHGYVEGMFENGEYIAPDGSKPTGFITIQGNRYYIDPITHKALTGIQTIDGKSIHFDANGVAGPYITRENGVMHAFDEYGQPKSGWVKDNGTWYYFSPKTLEVQTGWINDGGTWYYVDPATKIMHTGWLYEQNKAYYLNSNGAMAQNCTQVIDGYPRRFDVDGHCDKIGYQNPVGYYHISTWNVAPAWQASAPFNYMSPSRISLNASREECVKAFLTRAEEYLGTPYRWDYACAPGVGVDCVGLVMQSAYAVGMDLGDLNPQLHWATGPRGYHSHDAENMHHYGCYKTISLSQLQPGDLVFYPGHVAIYWGNGWIIEAYPPNVHWSHLYDHGTPSCAGRIFY